MILTQEELSQDPTEVFDVQNKLGEGSYGSVYRAVHKRSGLNCAIKVIPVDKDMDNTVKEISMMVGCDSPFVVQFYGNYIYDNSLWIVMEYCGAGSVSDIMKLTHNTMSETTISLICKHILIGLAYLHELRKIHRDIKAGNILLHTSGLAKLADFGVAGQLSDSVTKRNTVIGTPFWMAPEVIQEVGYGLNADIWSLGITCIEMAEGKPPYHKIHPMRAIFMIPTKPPPRLEDETRFSLDFIRFIERCLTKDPNKRPSAKDLLEDPFITNCTADENLFTEIINAVEDRIAKGELISDEEEVESEYEDDDLLDEDGTIKGRLSNTYADKNDEEDVLGRNRMTVIDRSETKANKQPFQLVFDVTPFEDENSTYGGSSSSGFKTLKPKINAYQLKLEPDDPYDESDVPMSHRRTVIARRDTVIDGGADYDDDQDDEDEEEGDENERVVNNQIIDLDDGETRSCAEESGYARGHDKDGEQYRRHQNEREEIQKRFPTRPKERRPSKTSVNSQKSHKFSGRSQQKSVFYQLLELSQERDLEILLQLLETNFHHETSSIHRIYEKKREPLIAALNDRGYHGNQRSS